MASSSFNAENVRMFPGVGTLLALCYVICLTYSELLVTVTPSLDAVTFIWFDSLCFCVVFIPILFITRQNPWSPFTLKDRCLLVAAGCSEVCCNVFIIFAVMKAPFGDVVTIWSTAIVLVPIVECLIAPYSDSGINGNRRGGKCPSHVPLQILLALLAAVGVIFISRPSFLFNDVTSTSGNSSLDHGDGSETRPSKIFSHQIWIGYACALGNAFSATSSYVIVGQLDHIRWAVVDFFFVPAFIVILPILTYFLNGFSFPSYALPRDYLAAIISGVLGVVGAIFCTLAQKIVTASTVTLMSILEIPASYLLDYIFNGVAPTWSTIGGASLVVMSVLGATVHTIIDDSRRSRELGKTESGKCLLSENFSMVKSKDKVTDNMERMALFGDGGCGGCGGGGGGDDDSEEGEIWRSEKKKDEETQMMMTSKKKRKKNEENIELMKKGSSGSYKSLP